MPWEQWTERMEKTINHQSKKGHSQENKKEQSTCAKQNKINLSAAGQKNQHYAPGCFMYLADEKKNKNSYLLAMFGCLMLCPVNNGQKEQKEQSTTREKATPKKTKRTINLCKTKRKKQLIENKTNATLPDVSCTWEMKRKTKTAIYRPCLAV